jgi:hypothetical protein
MKCKTQHTDAQHIDRLLLCCVSFILSVSNYAFMLNVVILSVYMLSVVAPVEYLTHNPNMEGLKPTSGTGKGKMAGTSLPFLYLSSFLLSLGYKLFLTKLKSRI